MKKIAWRIDKNGNYLSPEKQRSVQALEIKRNKRGSSYDAKTLTRYCPKCNAVITKKRRLDRNDELKIFRPVTVYMCPNCRAVWSSKQTNKVWQRLKKSSKKITNVQFKRNIEKEYLRG